MRTLSPVNRVSAKKAIALLLTFSAGNVDIVGYLTFYHTFTAHMTGETVHLAENLLQRHWFDAVVPMCVISAFLVGSIVGRTIIEIGWRTRLRSVASVTLLIEAVFIAVVALETRKSSTDASTLVLISLLAAAMGMQTATLTRIGSLTVHTTFVTGMLNKLAQLASQAMFLTYDVRTNPVVRPARDKVVRQAWFIFSIWISYFIGASTGVWMKTAWGTSCLFLAVGIIVCAIVVDHWAPLSIEEEQDQPHG